VGEQVENLDREGSVLHTLLSGLAADGGALDSRAADRQPHRRTPQAVPQLPQRGVVGDVDGEGAEGPFEGLLGGIRHRGDAAATQVLHDQGLEDVVDLCGAKRQLNGGRAVHRADALEVADPAGEQLNSG